MGSTHAEDIESLIHLGFVVEGIDEMALFVMSPDEAEVIANALLSSVKENKDG